jgi:hypothetical protein
VWLHDRIEVEIVDLPCFGRQTWLVWSKQRWRCPNAACHVVTLGLTVVPAGRAGGYEGWRIGAAQEEVSDGLLVVVAALDDVIDSKRAANRSKDQMALPYLESLRDELARS